MDMSGSMVYVVLAIITTVLSIIGWFLQKKDAAQEKAIETLFADHKLLERTVQALEVRLAGQHYEKPEVDAKLTEIRTTLTNGFESLGAKIDNLTQHLLKRP